MNRLSGIATLASKALLTSGTTGTNLSRHFASMITAKKFIYAKKFEGEPKLTDFKLVEEQIGPIKDGEILTQAVFHSVDPYMRPYMEQYPLGVDMIGGQIAKIIDSKNDKFPVGAYVFGQFGWRTHTVHNPVGEKDPIKAYLLPSFGNHPLSLGLGLLGMIGNTAYFGFLGICQPKAGEVVAITGAAGAVGSIVGQLAKMKGCTVIGFAGDDKKCEYLKGLGFDHAINYKTANIRKALKEAAPKGVNCYFDNVGGELSSQIISQMRDYGRIAVCGSISSYNATKMPTVPILQPVFVAKQLKMEGFLVWRYANQWQEGITAMKQYLDEGKLKYEETVTDGFEKLPEALIDMLRGGNTGKAIVKSQL